MDQSLDFCYLCFEQEKSLSDILDTSRECLELLGKLKICVSEVQWSMYEKLLVCDTCVEKLIKAHEFKKQCLQSSQTLKVYLLELENLRKEQKKYESAVIKCINVIRNDESQQKTASLIGISNLSTKGTIGTTTGTTNFQQNTQQIYPAIAKIILHNQSNQFQNVFLNLLPQNILDKTKVDGTKNAFITIPQVIQFNQPKIVTTSLNEHDEDVSKLLNDTNSEELSVEIDPLDYDMDNNESYEQNCRPIHSKGMESDHNYTNEEKMEFFNSGHFLLQDIEMNRYYCDKCSIRFKCTISLHKHIKQVHSNKYPYSCEHCDMEFASKDIYKSHLNRQHNEPSDLISDSITLTDFTNNSQKVMDLIAHPETKLDDRSDEEYKCDECDRTFASSQGLIRHKAKLHKNYKKKTYFVKGMKTAKCDICNRMFSTQSYMNLHRKLHDRKGEWRRKIFKPEQPLGQQIDDGEIFDNTDVDEDDDEINYRLDNVSEFLETSIRESAEATKSGIEHDNGNQQIRV